MIAPDAEIHVFEPYRAKHGTVHTTAARSFSVADGQKAVRLAALEADASATQDIDVARLWRNLARGTRRVVDSFFSEERCYLVLSLEASAAATPIEGRRLEILEAVLGGLRQKNIAIDLQLAPSTVALNSRLALESLGVDCKPSRAHPLLMLAARAAQGRARILARCSKFVAVDERELMVISAPRPDRRLDVLLPEAELSVIRRLVEGLSYGDIARRRGTSTRTIANQITAVFRRLKVSGRNELVQRLFGEQIAGNPLAKAAAETLVPRGMAEAKADPSLHSSRRSA